jgi:DNA-binding NarL/FixJ family response regulator
MAIIEQAQVEQVDLRVIDPTDGPEVLEQVLDEVPDVVVVSVRPGPIHPLRLCREVADHSPVSRVLVQATAEQAAHSYQALRVGAWGCLDPEAGPAELHDAAEAAARGEALLPARHAAWVLRELEDAGTPAPGSPPTADHLTAAERAVLHLLAEGAHPDTIADHLGVSRRVVGRHAGSALARLHRRYRPRAEVTSGDSLTVTLP